MSAIATYKATAIQADESKGRQEVVTGNRQGDAAGR